eukprot:CAMPEP_0198150196 /NCGR_PEP_ID=MMETSP1443-20131203/49954_1 /TAXON_ID=186043 /ORGANISM="Entomoneis sp., Strain CCMP2396" /LENGTH=237 /DNA_ID=CAMNT_0043815443 /DNA_START=43 /DNA_END=756 /DNA_ORIENTATION=+
MASIYSPLIAIVYLFCFSVDGFAPKHVQVQHVGLTTTETTRGQGGPWALREMKRPILDTIASTLFKLETSRVEASSEVDEMGRMGEPMAWSEPSSVANQFSEFIASNSLGYQFKQFVADLIAGDYDKEAVKETVDNFVNDKSAPIAMFSFTSCPFCRRAKDYLDEAGIRYNVMELDTLEGNMGNEIRAELGKKTTRTSVPSIFVRGDFVGGCNDGPGLLSLAESGELQKMLAQAKRR